jgi:hypothetical protein
MSVDLELARWLKEGVKFASADNAGVAAAFGALGRTTEIRGPLALAAGADAEAVRQVAFLGGPLVEDVAVVSGLRRDLLGKCITLRADPPEGQAANAARQLGYELGQPVFVIGYQEHDKAELTTLFVLRKLS